jgi:hypothetical protein
MYSRKTQLVFKFLLAVIVLFSLTFLWIEPVKAVTTCIWQGGNGDWAVSTNWLCGHVPTESDEVVINQAGVGPQINAATTGIDVNSITIASGAMMTVNATTNSLTAYANSFTNSGEIIINGDNASGGGLTINGSVNFSNNGTVRINSGGLKVEKGGIHAGDFVGAEHTVLSIGSSGWPGQTFSFTADSQIQVPIILVNGSPVVNIAGDFSPGLISLTPNESYLSISSGTTFNLTTTSVFMPYKVSFTSATLNLPDTPLDIFELVGMGTLYNPARLKIMEKLQLTLYTLTGAGDIEVDSLASTFQLGGGTISGKTIYNPITANWVSGNITLADGAVFHNSGTFNAKATTTMTGTAAESFINDGSFIKNTAGTTTTMNIPFTNNGTVDIVAGNLIFQQGMDNSENAVIDLGNGTLDPGTTLNLASGDSLIGSGTLAANLVSSGTISPGNSAGSITVQGDYTQSADGILKMELGGTTAGTQYDQLTVTGTATMAGTLDVSLINDFEPQVGDSFFIIDHSGEGSSGTGTFDTVSLPTLDGGLKLESDFSDEGVTLTVIDGGGSGGSISGTVTCNSTYTVFVDIWAGNTEPPPYRSITINCGDSYSFTDLPDGTYYVDAWIDIDGSGETGGPGDDEPSAWYGSPTAVEITGGNSQSGIDITFPSSNTGAIEGTVTCDSIHPVFVDLWASTTNPEPELSTTIACGGSYSFTNLPNGTYYVGAWIDLNESGDGPPDPGEPYVWYGDQTAVTITGGETKSGIDITFPAESFQLFLPLIVK